MPAASVPPPPRKKKLSSLFGGLLTKEPTLIALAQVEAELKAKHGAVTPQRVPHVSSKKMPDYVPKVNTKWDGVPEVVKAREREEKQRRRSSLRNSTVLPTTHSHGSEVSYGGDADFQRGFDADNSEEAWQSQERMVHGTAPKDSFSSAESRRGSMDGPPSGNSQSLRSPSGTSLPENSFFPYNHQPSPTVAPQMWQTVNNTSTSTQVTKSSNNPPRFEQSPARNLRYSIDATSKDNSSSITAPHELPTQVNGVRKLSQHVPQGSAKHPEPMSSDAFLAGEACALELNDDSDDADNEQATRSDLPFRRHEQPAVRRVDQDPARQPDIPRRRLGTATNMVVRTDAAPWEAQDPSLAVAGSLSPKSVKSPRGRFSKKLALFK